jgi:hypothetical protein
MGQSEIPDCQLLGGPLLKSEKWRTPSDLVSTIQEMWPTRHHGHGLKCGPQSWRTKMDAPEQ